MIKTQHIQPPIPVRFFDWLAYNDEQGPYGHGETEQQAIEDLREKLPEGCGG